MNFETRLICQMLAKFSGVEFQRTVSKLKKEIENRCLVFKSSRKREISQFHFVVVQQRQINVQKKRDARAKFCFANLKLLLLIRSRCRSRLLCLSSLIL